ncbi:MAG: RNA polymerase sigma factor [Flavobacteriaceae bacterium]|nr:RNA polymerase sigma factor [Flavobacteriaceae bacterium]
MTTNTDQLLIQKTLEGDTRSFGLLVEKYQAYVYTISLRMLKVKEEAEEVAQDTFIKAYASLSGFRGDSKFSSWLYSIAYRKALDRLRKNKRSQTSELFEEITEGDTALVENALDMLESKERRQKIKECIMQLPKTEAVLITLYYFEEQSVKEIAQIVDLSEENIKVKLFRSRKKLFNLLQSYVMPEILNTNGKAV